MGQVTNHRQNARCGARTGLIRQGMAGLDDVDASRAGASKGRDGHDQSARESGPEARFEGRGHVPTRLAGPDDDEALSRAKMVGLRADPESSPLTGDRSADGLRRVSRGQPCANQTGEDSRHTGQPDLKGDHG